MRHLLEREQLTHAFELESAGTGHWHVGEPPDRRAREAGKKRGLDVRGRAQRFTVDDFERFHYVVAMDRSNLATLVDMAPEEGHHDKIFLFRDFDADSPGGSEVPDPYYGGHDGFETVLDICEAAARGFLAHLRDEHDL